MAGFLYHVAGVQRPVSDKDIDAWGLRPNFTRPKPAHRAVNAQSPSGKSGGVFADPDRLDGKSVGYWPDQQTWKKLPTVEGRPELWVGYFNDAKPRPSDLLRKNALPSRASYELGGHHWKIPQLTELDDKGQGDCCLPAPEDYDDEGNLHTIAPTGEDGELWEFIHPLALAVCGFVESEYTIDDYREGAMRLLRRNYVVQMPELQVLGCLFRDDRYENIIIASCRAAWLLDAFSRVADPEKKTGHPPAAAGSTTTPGAAD
jgi:hypothetical protein